MLLASRPGTSRRVGPQVGPVGADVGPRVEPRRPGSAAGWTGRALPRVACATVREGYG